MSWSGQRNQKPFENGGWPWRTVDFYSTMTHFLIRQYLNLWYFFFLLAAAAATCQQSHSKRWPPSGRCYSYPSWRGVWELVSTADSSFLASKSKLQSDKDSRLTENWQQWAPCNCRTLESLKVAIPSSGNLGHICSRTGSDHDDAVV